MCRRSGMATGISRTSQPSVIFVIWTINVVLVVIFLLISHVPFRPRPSSNVETIRWALWFVALVQAGGVLLWGSAFSTKERITQRFASFRQEAGASLLSYYISRKIVTLSFIEGIAVYGLILALLGGYLLDQLLLSLLTGILLVLHYPSRSLTQE